VRAPRRLSFLSAVEVLTAEGAVERPLVRVTMVSVVDLDRLRAGLIFALDDVSLVGTEALMIASAV
jgi:hypothetical protein